MPDQRLEKIRDICGELVLTGRTGAGFGFGAFLARYKGAAIRIIASDDQGEGWEHVSVSLANRCPTWDEMCFVKDLFWLPEEAVMQLHPPVSDYVNNHPYCLHLWRPTNEGLPLPPSIYVGVKAAGTLKGPEEARALREALLKNA